MTKPKIITEVPINIAELKSELERIKKRDDELSFRANKTEEYLGQFSHVSLKKAKELFEKIESLKVPRLKENHIHKIIDILPRTADELKVVLQGYTITLSDSATLKKIVAAVNEFAPKK